MNPKYDLKDKYDLSYIYDILKRLDKKGEINIISSLKILHQSRTRFSLVALRVSLL